MIARLAVGLLSALACLGPVAAGETALEIKPKWKKGDEVRYELTRTQTREADGKVVRTVTSRTPVEVAVVDSGEDGTTLQWTQGSTVFDDPKHDDPLARGINSILKGLDVDLEVGADGSLTGVRNWKELRGTGHKIQDTLLTQMAKAGTAKTTIDLLRKELEKLFATQESVNAAFGKYPSLLLLPYGQKYELGKTITYDTELPNVFGGEEPFPATGECTLKSVDKESGVAVIVYKETIDPKESVVVIKKWVDEVAKKAGKPAPGELPEVEITDVIEYEFDLATGWAKGVTHSRTGKSGGATQTETVTLTRKAN